MYNLLVDGILSYAQRTYIPKRLQDGHILTMAAMQRQVFLPKTCQSFIKLSGVNKHF